MTAPRAKYRTLVADPPWPISWHGGGQPRENGGVPFRTIGYPTMALDEIVALPVGELAHADAALFLWVTAPLNREGIGVRVARAWGFEPVGEFVWAKGMRIAGAFPRSCHEIVLVCKRGQHQFTAGFTDSVQRWPTTAKHSQKPEGFTDLVEQVSPAPYLEIFARRQRLNWDTWGNECFQHVSMEPTA